MIPSHFTRLRAAIRTAALFLPLLLLGGTAPTSHATVVAPPVVVSSAPPFNATLNAANTVDQTEADYASAGQGANAFIEYSFASPQSFDKIVVINRNSAGQSDWIGDFTLTLNAGPTVSITRTPTRGTSQIHSLGGVFTATTVRLDVDTIGVGDSFNNTGAMEVLFVRTPVGQTPISATIAGSAPAFAPLFSVDNAIDGNVGRTSAAGAVDGPEYASAGQGANTFVDFDFGRIAPIGGFDFFDRPADEDRVTGFDLIFSRDATFGDPDDVVKSYSNSAMALGDVFAAVPAQFVRFDVTSNIGANTGISEMVFYQVPEPSAVTFVGLGLAGMIIGRRRR